MKIICPKESLLKGVNIALKAVPSRTSLEVLECILIQAEDGVITLTANDMELGIETQVEGEIEVPGKIAIDAKLFSEIVRRLPQSDITIETEENYSTNITCENAKFHISGRGGEDFTYLPEVEKDKYISLSQFTLKEMIRQTSFSISDNESNRMMGGELMEVTGNSLRMVTLDGHRVSVRKTELKEDYENISVIVPGKTLNDVSKIISGDNDAEILIFFSKNHIIFEFDKTVVVSRLIEGEFFKIDHLLNGDYKTKFQINKREFLDCIDRATLLIKESDKKPIILNIDDATLNLRLNSAIGSLNEEIMIHKTGNDIKIGFNPKFLIDALRAIDEESVDLYMVNSKAPCIIRDEEKTYTYLILPVNFVEE